MGRAPTTASPGPVLMAQVLKPEVRRRIGSAALHCFAHDGYGRTTMARIAESAGTTTGNLYRYHSSKAELFDAVVPPSLPAEHDRLLDDRIHALSDARGQGPAADQLLDFWLANRLAVVVLLDRAEGTPHAGYPAAFVARLVRHTESVLARSISPSDREVVRIVFDNTRRALAHILLRGEDPEQARQLVRTFWSYQLPGLDGLLAHLGGVTSRARPRR